MAFDEFNKQSYSQLHYLRLLSPMAVLRTGLGAWIPFQEHPLQTIRRHLSKIRCGYMLDTLRAKTIYDNGNATMTIPQGG